MISTQPSSTMLVLPCAGCFASQYVFVSSLEIVTVLLLVHVYVLDFNYEVRHNPVIMRCICILGFMNMGPDATLLR